MHQQMFFGSISSATGYQPAGALLFDGSADFLSWTPSSGSTNTSITYSFWAKRAGGLAAYGAVLAGSSGGGKSDYIRFSTDDDGVSGSDDALQTIGDDGNDWNVKTTPIYRDPTAWTHYVVSFNNTSDIRIWVNGTEVTAFNPNTESGTMGGWLRATAQYVGKNAANQYFNGYLADVICLDGTNVTNADNFGEKDSNTGIWVPKDPSKLTFNGNSFWLAFDDPTHANGFGKDSSGRNSHFTPSSIDPSNIAVDGPANSTDKEVTVYPILDPNATGTNKCVLSNNNLTYDWDGSGYINTCRANFGVSSGKYYWEVRLNNVPSSAPQNVATGIGIALSTDAAVRASSNSVYPAKTTSSFVYLAGGTGNGGTQGKKGSNVSGGPSVVWESYNEGTSTSGDIIGVAFDADNRTIWFSKNNSWIDGNGSDDSDDVKTEIQNGTTSSAAFTDSVLAAGSYYPIFYIGANDHDCTVRFSEDDWSYSPPSGFGELKRVVTGTGNAATLNPIASSDRKGGLSNGNLTASGVSKDNFSTMNIPLTGKWYFEGTLRAVAGTGKDAIGVAEALADQKGEYGSKVVVLYAKSGEKFLGTASSDNWVSYNATYAAGDTIGVYVNAGQVTFYNNGTSQGTCGSAFTTQCFATTQNANAATIWDVNFGQKPFIYTPPTDAKALVTQNLAEPTVTDPSAFYQTKLYPGNGSSQSLTFDGNSNMQPDLVWIKKRDGTANHAWYDRVRGINKELSSSTTNGEQDVTDGGETGVTAFGVNGFSVGNRGEINGSSSTIVAWCLKANGAGSSDDTGGITVTRSTASHQGFSICKGTSGTGTQNFAHGLGAKPEMVILRDLDDNSQHWQVQHKDVNANMADITTLGLNRDNAAGSSSGWWGTEPSPTLQYFTTNQVTGSNDFVCYLFRRVSGLIGIGKYTGGGSSRYPHVIIDDGASGFKPAFLLLKNISTSSRPWVIYDNKRTNVSNPTAASSNLLANTSATESSVGAFVLDFTASGFKIQDSAQTVNHTNESFIYLAFAETPFGLNNRAI